MQQILYFHVSREVICKKRVLRELYQVHFAKAINYDIWLMNMAELLDYEKVANCLSDEIRGILEKAKEYLED